VVILVLRNSHLIMLAFSKTFFIFFPKKLKKKISYQQSIFTSYERKNRAVYRPYSKSKLDLNSKKVKFEWCKNFFVCVYVFLFCT